MSVYPFVMGTIAGLAVLVLLLATWWPYVSAYPAFVGVGIGFVAATVAGYVAGFTTEVLK